MDTECWPHQAAGAAIGLALSADHGRSGSIGPRRHSESSTWAVPALDMPSHSERAGVDSTHPCWHHTRESCRICVPLGCANTRAGAPTPAFLLRDTFRLFVRDWLLVMLWRHQLAKVGFTGIVLGYGAEILVRTKRRMVLEGAQTPQVASDLVSAMLTPA